MKKPIQKDNKSKEIAAELKPFNIKNYYYLLCIVVFFVFANTISGGYNLDDELVTINHRFTSQGLAAVKDIFTNSYYADDMGYAYGYRPMVHLSFAIEHQFFSQSPKVSHFFNVLLYVLSIVLFFKLLLKWFGVEKWKIAFLAVILFAIHPIHTEVVASIKNRDEILAFLFIILSGLSMAKYLDKSKITSLLWLTALFAMAMLSKKSAYPMAIILPVAFILFREISKKQLIWMSLSVIIPAAIIGSELTLTRMFLMIILPCIGIGFAFLIKMHLLDKQSKITFKQLISKPLIPIILLIIVAGWSIYNWNFYGLLVTIPLLFWLIRINFQMGIFALVLLSLTVEYQFNYNEFSILYILVTLGFSFYLLKHRKNKVYSKQLLFSWMALTIVSLAIFLIEYHQYNHFLLLLNIALFFWLLFKKPLWALIYSLITIAITLFVFVEIKFYPFVFLAFSVLYLIKIKKWIGYFTVLIFSILVAFFSYETYQYELAEQPATTTELPAEIQKSIITPEQNSFLKEGRKLEFAENTLVAPHTTKETIGTGAATLGEYIRLMVFPNELSFYYGFARMDTVSLSNPFVWISILIHLGLIFVAIWQIKKRPIISFGIMWYLLSVILFSNWIELVAGMVAERLIFIASAGFSIFIAGVIYWIKPAFLSKKPFILEGMVALVLLLFVFKTINRNSLWKDPLTLMEHDVKHLQNSAQANNLYALRLMEYSTENISLPQTEKDEIHQMAMTHFSNAIRIDSTFFNALFDKGRAAQFAGDTKTAIETFKIAIKREPQFLDSYQFLLMEYEKEEDWPNYLKIAKLLVIKNDVPNNYDFISKGFFMQNQADSSLFYINQALLKFPNEPSLLERREYLKTVVVAK